MAVSIRTGLKEIAFCDSPQYLVVDDDGAGGGVPSYQLNLFIWQGPLAAQPVTPTHALIIEAQVDPFGGVDATTGVAEVSDYIKAFLDADKEIITDGSLLQYSGLASAWFTWDVNAAIAGTQSICTLGAGVYDDGVTLNMNSGTTVLAENGKVFGHQSPTLVADVNRAYIIPIYVGLASSNNIVSTSGGDVDLAVEGWDLNSDDSSRQWIYFVLDPADYPSDWIEGADFFYSINSAAVVAALTPPIFGMYFDGISTYMDIGNVDLITQATEFAELSFLARNWVAKNPFGYTDGTNGHYYMDPDALYNPTLTRVQSGVGLNSNFYAGEDPEALNKIRYEWVDATNIRIELNDNLIAVQPNSTTTVAISVPTFFLGAANSGGPVLFAESVWVYAEFNGTIYNDANDWNGATNFGGVRVVSFDSGVTWYPAESTIYRLKVTCSSGRPKSLKYLGLSGAVHDFPINGSDFDTVSVRRTTFNNLQINPTLGGYDTTRHVKKTFAIDSMRTVELDTGWIFEDTPRMVSEMLVSKLTWFDVLEEDGITYNINPSHILDSSLRFIRRQYRKQIGYKLRVEIARPLLNKVT